MSKKPTQGEKLDAILEIVQELANRPEGGRADGVYEDLMNLIYGTVARFGVKTPGGQVLMVAQIPYMPMPESQGLTFEQQEDGTVLVSIISTESPATEGTTPPAPAEAGEETPGEESDGVVAVDSVPPASPSPDPAELPAAPDEDDPEIAVDMTPGL